MFSSIAFTAYFLLSLLPLPVSAASLGTQDLALRQSGGPYDRVVSSKVLGYWPFVDTFFEVSPNGRGPAFVNGANVNLTTTGNSGYVKIRKPGFLNIPMVDIRTINFGIEFSLRLPSAPTSRQILLSNWQSGQWQYLMTIETTGKMSFVLRRNINTNGSDPAQDLVGVTTAEKVPVQDSFGVHRWRVIGISRRSPWDYGSHSSQLHPGLRAVWKQGG